MIRADEMSLVDIAARLAAASSFETVAIARALAELFDVPSDAVVLPPGQAAPAWQADLVATLNAPADDAGRNSILPPEDAADLAGAVLRIAASDAVLEPYVRQAIMRSDNDESMNAIEILAAGAAWSLVILVATTRVEIEPGKPVRVVKEALDGRTIVKLIDALRRMRFGGK